MKALFVLAVLTLAACSEVTPPTAPSRPKLVSHASGDMIVNETTPIDLVLLNACNGEEVLASGTLQTKTEVTTPSNGSYHVRLTNDYTFSGVGQTTGAKYEGGVHFVDKENYNTGGATVFDMDVSARLIGQGNVPNTWLDVSTAFTMNADGTLTHDKPTFTSRCT